MKSEATSIRHDKGRVTEVILNGEIEERVTAAAFMTSMPIQELVARLDPPAPQKVQEAAESLRYRDFLTVTLIVDRPNLFPDNWIYIHSPGVKVGRVQNFKNWSSDMVPDQEKTSLGLEYFVQEGDEMWNLDDGDLIELARKECHELGLAPAEAIEGGIVIRVKKAYPLYDHSYKQQLAIVRDWVAGLQNLQLIGRNGQHRYNNQDHSMMTGVLAARNLAGEQHDI